VRADTGPPSRVARNVVVGGLIAFTISSWTGDLLLSVLIPDRAVILLVLNDRLRNYALASPHLDTVEFYAVALVRLVAPYPLFFLIGRWYGDDGVAWMERRTPFLGRLVRRMEALFSRAAYPLVALVPMNVVCVFAGASGMSMAGFLVAKVIGSIVLLVVARRTSLLFDTPLTAIGEWIGDHRLLVLGVSAVLLGASIWLQRRSQGGTEIDHLAHLDSEIAAIDAERRAEGRRTDGSTD
jgi:membrane protein DedA with SNARE-associated domain